MKTASFALCATLLLALPAAGQTRSEQWQIGTTPSFSSGRFGTDTRTEVFHTPITTRRLFADGDVTLVFPFTCIRGNGSVTVVNGTPIRTDTSGAGTARDSTSTRGTTTTTTRGSGTSATITRAADAPAASAAPTTAAIATACGMGDIIVRGRYYILDEGPRTPTIALRAHIKAPTADADTGLGTGRADEGIGVEVSRTVGGGVTVMADGGYTFIGTPAGVQYNNTWWYDVGLGKDMARGVVNLSVFVEEYRAIVPGLPSARDVLAALTVKGTGGWRLQFSGEIGLSDGAPDHGIAFGASRRF